MTYSTIATTTNRKRETKMTKIQTITEEAQLTDFQGWFYRDENYSPSYTLPQIMNLLYKAKIEVWGIEEELDWDDTLRLAVYISNVDAFGDLTPDRLNELWAECEENYQGEFATEGDFAEDFHCGHIDSRATENLVIDWQGTYDYSLQYDYFNVFVTAGMKRQMPLR